MELTEEWMAEGAGQWAEDRCRFSWSLRDVSARSHLMGSCGTAILLVTKAKMAERGLFKQLLWIQYTEALVDGKVYTPPPSAEDPTPWPWVGIDRYPNTIHRKDHLPYVSLPAEQQRVDWGHAYEGRIRSLYDNKGADSVDVDWASSGHPNWGHYSVLTLIGRGYIGAEWSIGSLAWRWSRDAAGNAQFGAKPADAEDLAAWTGSMSTSYPQYMSDTFQGAWPQ